MGISKEVGFVFLVPLRWTSRCTVLIKRHMSGGRVGATTPPTTSWSHGATTVEPVG